MKRTFRSVLSLFLVAVMLFSFFPEMAMASDVVPEQGEAQNLELSSAQETAEPEIPVRDLTQLQQANASATEAALDAQGPAVQDGDFTYRLLNDGTAVVVGYTGKARTVSVPLTLGGADVTAIASGAFGSKVEAVTIHGNVLYMEDGALPAGAAVAAWQGSYSAAWAQARGFALSSLTEGVLYEDVIDMTDVLERVTVLSDSMLSLPVREAQRLAVGDTFILNHGDNNESLYTVTAMREIGGQVYLTVEKADPAAVFLYRLYEGTRTATFSFSGSEEVGVDLESEVQAASEVFEDTTTNTDNKTPFKKKTVTISLENNRELVVSYNKTTTVTTAYRVVIENGIIISGEMASEDHDTNTLEVKYKYKGKFIDPEGGVGSLKDPLKKKEHDDYLLLLKTLKGKTEKEKLGSYVMLIIPTIGLNLEFKATIGWEIGGEGSVTWEERTLKQYDYSSDKEAWALNADKTISLNTPSPDLTGSVYGKVSASVGVSVKCLWVTSELQMKMASTLSLKMTVPTDPAACITIKLDFDITLTIEVGLWVSAGKWEVQLGPAATMKLTLLNITLLNAHYSSQQGIHRAAVCAYTPMDYSVRFVTGTEWQPKSVCYLKEGSYTYLPFTAKVYSFSVESVLGNVEEVSADEFDRIKLKAGIKISDALDGEIELPKAPSKQSQDYANWRMTEPETLGEYFWDESKSVGENLTAATGNSYNKEDDLPKTITLEADWSNKYHVDYDANGGEFPSGQAVGPVLTKYYLPGEKCEVPIVQPIKTLSRFIGWSLDPLGNTPWNGVDSMSENLRVYAQYEDFDPTSQATINARFGSSPTVIGQGSVRGEEAHAWTLTIGGRYPDNNTLNMILTLGVNEFEASTDGLDYLDLYGSLNCSTDLRLFRGKVTSLGTISLTALVDPSIEKSEVTFPSTINGMPVAVEHGVLQNLRAETVVFGAAPSGDLPVNTETDSALFAGNTYVKNVYMDTTGIVKLGNSAFQGCTNLRCVTLPGTLQKIGSRAFQGCEAIWNAKLGLQVDTVGEYAFGNCTNLSTVIVSTPYLSSMQKAFQHDYYYNQEQTAYTPIDLILENTVLALPYRAFYNCSALGSVTVAEDGRLFAIGDSAFYGTGITSLKLNEGLQKIEANAFAHTELTEVEIPASVTDFYVPTEFLDLERHVFYNAPLRKITIGGEGGITTIPHFMLYINKDYANTLEEVMLREGVTEIGYGAFSSSASISGSSTGYFTFGNLRAVTLPSTLTTIGASAFANAATLERVGPNPDSLPAGRLELPKGLTSIGESAFNTCRKLTSTEIPASVTEIKSSTFAYTGLKSLKLNEGLRKIEARAFRNTALTEVEIPASVTDFYVPTEFLDLERHVFYNAPLRKITIGGEGGITTIPHFMLYINKDYANTLEEVMLREGVTEIGYGAFSSSASISGSSTGYFTFGNLRAVTLPSTVTTIGASAFANAATLERVGPDPDSLPAGRLELPRGLTSIGESAFNTCRKLTSTEIPASVTEIKSSTFAYTGLKSLKLNEGLRKIEARAFRNTALTEVEIPASVTDYYVPTEFTALEGNIFYDVPLKKITIGGAGGITAIPQYMFALKGNSGNSLEEVVLREGVTEIGGSAFSSSSSYYRYPNLKKVTLPSTLTTIGNSAFYYDAALEKVIAGPNLSSIGDSAFYRAHPTFYALPGTARNAWLAAWCQEKGYIYDPDTPVTVTARFDNGLEDDIGAAASQSVEAPLYSLLTEPETPQREGWSFLGWFQGDSQTPWNFAEDRVGATDLTLTARWQRETANGLYAIEDGHAVLLSYALAEGESGVVALPPTWQGVPVTAIADGAFDGARVTTLSLPATVTSLSPAAFLSAESLCWIEVQKGSPAFSSRDGILYSADGTRLLCCPAGKLPTEYTVPAGVTEIGPDAFRDHETLQTVSFNEELTTIGDRAFYGCGLTELVLPDGLQSIGASAFRDCSDLDTVAGAASCVRIGANAFASTGFCIFYGEEDSALVQYALANDRPYNIYTVSFQLDGETVRQYRVKAGESLPHPVVTAPEERIAEGLWYTDAELTELWSFETGTMPRADLSLYARTLPLFETEEYTGEAAEGEEPVTGLRVTGYNGDGTAITVPETIGNAAVCAVNAEAFPEGCALTLPGALQELDVDAFIQRNILLYAPVGSATEQLLLAAEYTLNAAVHTLYFESSGGTLVAPLPASTGEEIQLPEAVRDGGVLLGWYSDKALSTMAGVAGESFTMPDGDVTLYARWDGDAPTYGFEWEQRGDSIAVVGGKGAAEVEIPAAVNGLPVTVIEAYAFADDAALERLTLPEGMTEIGAFAFYGSGLTGAVLPDTVTTVGRYAFAACRGLRSIAWNASADIVGGMFSGDGALESLTLPEGIAAIGDYALEGCSQMKTLTIPDSVTSLGAGALKNMSSLETLMLGQNTTTLGAGALDGCQALKSILVAAGNTHYESVDGVLYYSGRAGVVRYPAGSEAVSCTVDASAMLVESRAFAGAKNLKTLVLPGGIVQLGSEAFAESGLTGIDLSGLTALTALPANVFGGCRSLPEVQLPSDLTEIGGDAFRSCDLLAELDIPDTVSTIGEDAFPEDVILIVGANTEAQRYAQANGLRYRLRGQAEIPAASIITEKGSLTLMEGKIYTLTVTVEPADTTDEVLWFSENPDILRADDGVLRPLRAGETEITVQAGETELTLPVKVIKEALKIDQATSVVFEGGTLQLTVSFSDNVVPGTVSWESEGAAITADGLLSPVQTGLATVTATMASGSAATVTMVCVMNENTLTLPAMLQTVEEEAFRGSGLLAVVLPEGMSAVGDYAFADCAGLRLVLLPDSVTELSPTAFDNSPDVLLVASGNGPAEALAAAAGLPFVPLG